MVGERGPSATKTRSRSRSKPQNGLGMGLEGRTFTICGRYSGFDPIGDTESRSGNQSATRRPGVTVGSIRLGILKGCETVGSER